jgi:3-oxoacyl-[acyl-carrier protein] reductase
VRCAAVVADALDEGALVDAIRDLRDKLGAFRHLVNVIGGGTEPDWTANSSMQAFDHTIDLNLRYAVVSCREVARELRLSGEAGSIVNLSSLASTGGYPLMGSYAAAKAGLVAFSRTMAMELGPAGIRVNVVELGPIRRLEAKPEDQEVATRAASVVVPLHRQGEPAEAAMAVLFLLSDLAGYTTGHVLRVDGGESVGSADPSPFLPAAFLARAGAR